MVKNVTRETEQLRRVVLSLQSLSMMLTRYQIRAPPLG